MHFNCKHFALDNWQNKASCCWRTWSCTRQWEQRLFFECNNRLQMCSLTAPLQPATYLIFFPFFQLHWALTSETSPTCTLPTEPKLNIYTKKWLYLHFFHTSKQLCQHCTCLQEAFLSERPRGRMDFLFHPIKACLWIFFILLFWSCFATHRWFSTQKDG